METSAKATRKERGSLLKTPISTSSPIPGRVVPEIPHSDVVRTAVRQVKVFFRSFDASRRRGVTGVSQPACSPLARVAQRSQEVLKGKTTGMGFPSPGIESLPGSGSKQQIDAHKHSPLGDQWAPQIAPPAPVLQGKRNESLAAEERRTASQPVRPKKRKSFIKEASWPSKCLKAGWWMRRSASTGPIRRVTGASTPIAASARKMFSWRS
jgi:hypothetical protein